MFLLTILFFILGLTIGSFLNVVVARYNTSRSLRGRSACMSCRNQLCWYELIPLFSFLGLRGRCLNCKTKISKYYPTVELITGVIFAGIFLKFQDIFFLDISAFAVTYGYYAILFSLLVVIASYDLKHKIIPDLFSGLLFAISFIGLFIFDPFVYGISIGWPEISELFSGALVALPFVLFWLFSRGAWMGLGDAKLALGLGYMLGLGRALSAVVMSFWIGAIVGIFLMVIKNQKIKSEIPFAPFLVLGTALAFFFELYLFPVF
ncbi:MAG: prepilin peptidase [Candidatus Paceibacterota bacterium]